MTPFDLGFQTGLGVLGAIAIGISAWAGLQVLAAILGWISLLVEDALERQKRRHLEAQRAKERQKRRHLEAQRAKEAARKAEEKYNSFPKQVERAALSTGVLNENDLAWRNECVHPLLKHNGPTPPRMRE